MLFSDYLRLLRRSLLLLIVFAAVGAIVGLGASLLQKPQYKSTAVLFVSAQQAANLADLSQGATFTEQLVRSYATVVPTSAVLQPAIDSLGLDITAGDLAKRIEATTPLDTVVLDITVTDTSPSRAARLANAVSASLSRVVQNVTPPTADTATAVRLVTMQSAQAPASASAPRVPVYVAIGVAAGLALAALIALARNAVKRQDRDRELQLQRRSGRKVVTDG